MDTKTFTLLFEVYIVNKSVSKRFDGITKHFEFVAAPNGSTDNTVLKCKNTFSVTGTYQLITENLPSDILQKESLMRKQDAIRRFVRALFAEFIKTKMNTGYRDRFDTSRTKVSVEGNYQPGTRYTVSYKEKPFAYLVQMPEAVQLELFKEPE